MEKKNIDWSNLGFGYHKTDYNVRCYYRDGKWGEIEVCSEQRIEQQLCDEKPTNAEITVFLCRKLLLFGVRCGIMWIGDKMH